MKEEEILVITRHDEREMRDEGEGEHSEKREFAGGQPATGNELAVKPFA
jgi:hypothetical protein